MSRISSFFLGVLVGASGLYVSTNYHVVHASDGLHWVPKLASKIEFPYVDIRKFSLQDWERNKPLALAIVRANKSNLMHGSAIDSFRQSTENLFQQWTGKP